MLHIRTEWLSVCISIIVWCFCNNILNQLKKMQRVWDTLKRRGQQTLSSIPNGRLLALHLLNVQIDTWCLFNSYLLAAVEDGSHNKTPLCGWPKLWSPLAVSPVGPQVRDHLYRAFKYGSKLKATSITVYFNYHLLKRGGIRAKIEEGLETFWGMWAGEKRKW